MSLDKTKLESLRIDHRLPVETPARRWLIPIVLVAVLTVIGVVWLLRPRTIPVRCAVARETTATGQQTILNASGYVTARRQATVSSKVTGKVVEVLVEEGMRVEAGQLLARLDTANVMANLRLAEAQLEVARKALDETQVGLVQADKELKRIVELARQNIASASDLDRGQSAADSLRARLDRQRGEVISAERQVALWKQQLEDNTILAPFSGIVVAKNAQPGEMISPISAGGSFTRTGICTIVDMASLEIEVDVNESYINRVEAGQPVEATLDSYPDWHLPAKVIAIIPTADRQKATVKVRIGFEKLDPKILPDMGVKVAFQGHDTGRETVRSVAVPKTALREDQGQTIVFLLRDGKLERRAVTLGRVQKDQAILAAGIAPGDRVVVEGPATLKAGVEAREIQK